MNKRFKAPWTRLGLILALSLLISACASLGVSGRIHLPEPDIPACLTEAPREGKEAVGRLEFSAAWVDGIRHLLTDSRVKDSLEEVSMCASETAKALRQAIIAIRLNNQTK